MNLRKKIKIILYLFILWFGLHSIYIIFDGLHDNGGTADCAVILGNKVNSDGTLSERLEERLKCGLNLYNNKRVKRIIVSGGLGKEGFYEGDKMKEYLINKGIPDSIITVDNKGNNTLKTVENTIKLKDSLNFKSLIIVSQYFHLTRTRMLYRKHNFDNIESVSPNYFELRDLYAITREFFAYYLE